MTCRGFSGRRYFFHSWGKWRLLTFNGTTFRLNERQCVRCGFTQTRTP